MTADCPLGIEAFRRNLGWEIAKVAGIAFFFLALLAGAISLVADKPRNSTRRSAGPMTPIVDWIMHKLCPHPIMGAPAPPPNSSNGGCNPGEENCQEDDPANMP
jgi:hypothetical protein